VKNVENTCNETEGKRVYGDTVCARLSELYAATFPSKVGRKLSWLATNLCLCNLLSSLVTITCKMSGGSRNYEAHHCVIFFILLLLCSLSPNIFLCTLFIKSHSFS